MKILILGGNGMLGPWTIKALEGRHDLRVTDINDPSPDFKHDYVKLDASDHDGVVEAAAGMDVIVNLSVLRQDRKLAFDVSTRGNYNMMVAARKHGIGRVVNTGPHFQTVGPQYEEWDFGLNPEMPPAPGTRLYALSKALGQEITRIYAERHGIQVLTLHYYNMMHSDTLATAGGEAVTLHNDLTPFSVAWPDAGDAIRCAVEVPESVSIRSSSPSSCSPICLTASSATTRFDGSSAGNRVTNSRRAGTNRWPVAEKGADHWAPVSNGVTMEWLGSGPPVE